MLHDLQSCAGVLDHFQVSLVRPFEATHPVAPPLGLIPAVDPYLTQALDPRGNRALQQGDQAESLSRMGRRDDHRDEQPQGIDQDMPLTPFD